MFEGNEIRLCGTSDAPLFIAADVCTALEIKKCGGAVESLDTDEKDVVTVSTAGGPQQMTAVTESGLYHLIFKSRKAAAKRFRRWVTEEVLPSIRKNGFFESSPFLSVLGELERQSAEGTRMVEKGREQLQSVAARRDHIVAALFAAAPKSEFEVTPVPFLVLCDAVKVGTGLPDAEARNVVIKGIRSGSYVSVAPGLYQIKKPQIALSL